MPVHKKRKKKLSQWQQKRNMKKINKAVVKTAKSGKVKKAMGMVTVGKKTRPSKIKATGKIKKGFKSVKLTEGGAYASYAKKSKTAGKFRDAFSKASKSGKKSFTWQGRKYTTKKK